MSLIKTRFDREEELRQILFADEVKRATAHLVRETGQLPTAREVATFLRCPVTKVRQSRGFHDRVVLG